MTRQQALHVLALPPDADDAAVKRAYRQLARTAHPDAGGDAATFRDLQLAYERLVTSPPVARERQRRPSHARPSRRTREGDTPTQPWSEHGAAVDDVDWDAPAPGDGMVALDLSLLARALARPHAGPVHPVTARSRGPRSPVNRWLHLLADDLTATLAVRPARERGRRGHDVEVWLRAWSRRERKLLETATLPDDWVLLRGSSSTTAIRTLAPSQERRATAARAARAADVALDRVGWPLTAWYAPGADLA